MAISKPKLLPLVALFLMLLLANKVVHSQNTISFNINSFNSEPAILTYQGDTHVPPGSSFLRLTKTDPSGTVPGTWSVGRVLYSTPIQLWRRAPAKQASFDTTISFKITPSPNGAADGLAFFIAPVGSGIPSGSAGENLGIFESSGSSSSLFAVEFDTYFNYRYDPKFRHIGIDVNSRSSRTVEKFPDLGIGQGVTARITYDGDTQNLTIVASTPSRTYTLSDEYELKRILPEKVQVGISSSTGSYVEELGIHDVFSWSFTSTLL